MKKKSKVLGLAKSMIALVVCVVMLIGTTLAWFTVEVTNNGNRIEAGKMELNLLKYDDIEKEYRNIGEDKLFDGVWEPGKTKVAFLAVENAGTLDFNYQIVLNITEGDKPLSAVLDYAILSPMNKADFDTAFAGKNWATLVGTDGVESGDMPLGEVVAAPKGALESGEKDYFALAIYMDPNAGDDYQGGWINIDLEINAKQMASEDDYFGDQYDAGTEFPTEPPAPVEWEIHHPHGLLDFEDGLEPMTVKTAPAEVVDDNGDKVLKLGAGGRAQYSNVDSTKQYGIVKGNTYRLSGYYKVEDSATVPSFHLWHVGADTHKLTDYVVSTTEDGWNYFEFTFTATNTRDTLVQFILNAYDATGSTTVKGVTYFDDIAFEIYVGDQNG